MPTVSILYNQPGQRHKAVQVLEQGQQRLLRFGDGGGWQGALDMKRPNRPVFPYQRAFSSLVWSLSRVERFMALGVGTGTALRTVQQAFPHCDLYGVEIDEVVLDVAIRFFGSPSHNEANYWVGDGVTFLCTVDVTFDLIFVDAYLSNQVYAPCLDPTFVHVLDAALDRDGTAVCNLITVFPPRGQVRGFIDQACAVFPYVAVLPVGFPMTEQNALLVLSKSERVPKQWRFALSRAPQLRWLDGLTWPMRVRSIRSHPVL